MDIFRKHPLLAQNSKVSGCIRFVRLDYIENTIRAPVPRCQDLPEEAFGTLGGRSILIATSHAWFYQAHPDPNGAKLNVLRETLVPRIRKRFPKTEILVFDDWMSCPQRPRTVEEDGVFYEAMNHMNSVYLYCDCVVLIEADLPKPSRGLHRLEIQGNLSGKYDFQKYVDVVQIAGIKPSEEEGNNTMSKLMDGGDDSNNTIGVLDTIVRINNRVVHEVEDVIRLENESNLVHYRKRPFGRPNQKNPQNRGWLFLERFTAAVKVAMGGEECFDAVIFTNSSNVRNEIYFTSVQLLTAVKKARRLGNEDPIAIALDNFRAKLKLKEFTVATDEVMVTGLMDKLVDRFKRDWNSEKKKQRGMLARGRQLLLQWGKFSDLYIARASLENPFRERSSRELLGLLCRILETILLPSLVFLPLFLIPIPEPPNASDTGRDMSVQLAFVGFTSLVGTINCATPVVIQNAEFAKIPIGVHTIGLYVWALLIAGVTRMFLFTCIGSRMSPFNEFIGNFLSVTVGNYLSSIKFIRVTDEHGNERKQNIGAYFMFPSHMRFDPVKRADVKRSIHVGFIVFFFIWMYPLLNSIFANVGAVAQGIFVPFFYGVRFLYEQAAAKLVAPRFSSDKMPAVIWFGVCIHEICLSVMLAHLKHPVIFVMLVALDVGENGYCLYCLYAAARKSRMATSTVVPASPNVVMPEKLPKQRTANNTPRHRKRYLTSATRRLSSVSFGSMTNDLSHETSPDKAKRMAYYIIATLLVREFVEVVVPLQSAIAIYILREFGTDHNTLVYQMDDDDFRSTMHYILLDAVVEFVIFAISLVALKIIFPSILPHCVLFGVLNEHHFAFFGLNCAAWMMIYVYQHAYSGVDETFNFDWLHCAKNATWEGGFEWSSS